MKKKPIILLLIIVLLAAAIYGWFRSQQAQQHDLKLYGNVDIRTVNLGFRVAGRLATLERDEGATIEPGQLLGTLNADPYQNALNQAQANVAAQKANLDLLRAGYRSEVIAQAKATVAQQQSALDYAQRFYQRHQTLWGKEATSHDALDNARNARDQTQASLQAAQDLLTQYLNGNRPQEIAQAEAALKQAEAMLAQAKLNLQDTNLYSPSAGVILTRAVEPGTMLNAGGTVFSLSLTSPVWVRTYVDETNLHRVVPGSKVTVYTDGRPQQPYHAEVGFVSPTAEFTPKSVETPELRTDLVYRLRLIVTDPDQLLRQGMPVTIHVGQ
ncbi:secretion protein HlyD [Serratia proteamaculans]|jgi:HlyD family secretion protein